MMATGADDEHFLDSDCSTHESGFESNHPDLRPSEKEAKQISGCLVLQVPPWII